MANFSDEIAAISAGARFWRADLHVHSFGGSHDVKDSSNTPTAIVNTALSEGLSVIAITDHNEIANVEQGLKEGLGDFRACHHSQTA